MSWIMPRIVSGANVFGVPVIFEVLLLLVIEACDLSFDWCQFDAVSLGHSTSGIDWVFLCSFGDIQLGYSC